MIKTIAKGIKLSSYEADHILRIAYKKGYIKCDDVLNGCDYFNYEAAKDRMEFHIQSPIFWEYITTKQFIYCYIELLKYIMEEIEND